MLLVAGQFAMFAFVDFEHGVDELDEFVFCSMPLKAIVVLVQHQPFLECIRHGGHRIRIKVEFTLISGERFEHVCTQRESRERERENGATGNLDSFNKTEHASFLVPGYPYQPGVYNRCL